MFKLAFYLKHFFNTNLEIIAKTIVWLKRGVAMWQTRNLSCFNFSLLSTYMMCICFCIGMVLIIHNKRVRVSILDIYNIYINIYTYIYTTYIFSTFLLYSHYVYVRLCTRPLLGFNKWSTWLHLRVHRENGLRDEREW